VHYCLFSIVYLGAYFSDPKYKISNLGYKILIPIGNFPKLVNFYEDGTR